MTNPLHVPPNDSKTIRVFGFAGSETAFQALSPQPDGNWPLKQALGATHLDPEGVETFDVAELGDLGLSGYLAEGNAIPDDQIAALRPALDNIAGYAVLVYANAFGGIEQTLSPAPELEFVGLFRQPGTDWSATPITSDSAKPYSAPPADTPHPRKTRIGSAVFGILAALITFAILWMIF